MIGHNLQSLTSMFTFPVLPTGQRVEQCYIGCPPGWPMELGCAPGNQCKYGTVDSRRGTKDFMEVNPATGQPWMSYPYTDAQGNQALYTPPIAITYGITWDDGTTTMSHNPAISIVDPYIPTDPDEIKHIEELDKLLFKVGDVVSVKIAQCADGTGPRTHTGWGDDCPGSKLIRPWVSGTIIRKENQPRFGIPGQMMTDYYTIQFIPSGPFGDEIRVIEGDGHQMTKGVITNPEVLPVEVINTTKTTKTAGVGEKSNLLMYLLVAGGLYYAYSQGMFKKLIKN